jgi:hypothetical protein
MLMWFYLLLLCWQEKENLHQQTKSALKRGLIAILC